jgi:hypothetical protein
MKRFALTVTLILLSALPVVAQQPSVTYSPLTGSTQFLNRVQFNIVQSVDAIEREAVAYTPAAGDSHPATAACHTLRANLAAAIARNPSGYSLVFASHLVTNGAITTAGALTGGGNTSITDTPATDGALFSAVNAIWSTVAGCISNP